MELDTVKKDSSQRLTVQPDERFEQHSLTTAALTDDGKHFPPPYRKRNVPKNPLVFELDTHVFDVENCFHRVEQDKTGSFRTTSASRRKRIRRRRL